MVLEYQKEVLCMRVLALLLAAVFLFGATFLMAAGGRALLGPDDQRPENSGRRYEPANVRPHLPPSIIRVTPRFAQAPESHPSA